MQTMTTTEAPQIQNGRAKVLPAEARRTEVAEAQKCVEEVIRYSMNGHMPSGSATQVLGQAYDKIREVEQVGANEIPNQQTILEVARLRSEVSDKAMKVMEVWAEHAVAALEAWATTEEGRTFVTMKDAPTRQNWWFPYDRSAEVPDQVRVAEDAVEAAAIARQSVPVVDLTTQQGEPMNFIEDPDAPAEKLKDRLRRIVFHPQRVHDDVYNPAAAYRYAEAQRVKLNETVFHDIPN